MKKGYFQIRIGTDNPEAAAYKPVFGLVNDRYGIHGSTYVGFTVTQLKSGLAIHKFDKKKHARKFVEALGNDDLTTDEIREIRDTILKEVWSVSTPSELKSKVEKTGSLYFTRKSMK